MANKVHVWMAQISTYSRWSITVTDCDYRVTAHHAVITQTDHQCSNYTGWQWVAEPPLQESQNLSPALIDQKLHNLY